MGTWFNKKFTSMEKPDDFSNTVLIGPADKAFKFDNRFTNSQNKGTAAMIIRKTIMTKNRNFIQNQSPTSQGEPNPLSH